MQQQSCCKGPLYSIYTPGPGMVIFTNDKLSKNQCRHNTGPFTMGTCQPHWVTSTRLCTSSFCRLRPHAFLLPGAVPATPIFSIIIHRVPFPAAVLTLPPAWHLIQCNHGLHTCKCSCNKDIPLQALLIHPQQQNCGGLTVCISPNKASQGMRAGRPFG